MMKPKWETTAPVEPEPTEDEKKEARFLAKVATSPSANAAQVLAAFGTQFTNLTLNGLVERLSESIKGVWANDMRLSEAMLYAQAVALQSIFSNLAQRAASHKGQRLDEAERCLRMALKAQNQSRMTLETLWALKNPRVVVGQQTNIANGPQQVNNGPVACGAAKGAPTQAPNTRTGQNELLEVKNGERLDAGAAGATGHADQELEAVAAINGATNGGREGEGRAKPVQGRQSRATAKARATATKTKG
jgi:hypothetical protein